VTRILVVNAGSTSLKLHVVDGAHARRLDSVDDARDVDAVAHRIVHGGARFRDPTLIDADVERELRALEPIAPLHNTPALRALADARARFPDLPHVAVFDTAFHATIPEEASTYAVPLRWRDDWEVRRYGFHGLSVEWSASQVRVPRLVVCHLGGGCSVTAVRDGRSLDTTMGFSPLEGVPMATRSGSIDPGALLYLLRERKLTLEELDRALEHESGLLALGGSADVRELQGTLALEVFTYRVAGAVAAMAAALGGIDALVFTAGIGEHATGVRDAIVDRLRFLGDFAVHVVEAREELVAARHARDALVGGRGEPS
jgi:acetate kinase